MTQQDALAHQPIFQIKELRADLIGGELRTLTACELTERRSLDLADLGIALLFFGDCIRGGQVSLRE